MNTGERRRIRKRSNLKQHRRRWLVRKGVISGLRRLLSDTTSPGNLVTPERDSTNYPPLPRDPLTLNLLRNLTSSPFRVYIYIYIVSCRIQFHFFLKRIHSSLLANNNNNCNFGLVSIRKRTYPWIEALRVKNRGLINRVKVGQNGGNYRARVALCRPLYRTMLN